MHVSQETMNGIVARRLALSLVILAVTRGVSLARQQEPAVAVDALESDLGGSFKNLDEERKALWTSRHAELREGTSPESLGPWNRFLQGALIGGGFTGTLALVGDSVRVLANSTTVGKAITTSLALAAAGGLAIGAMRAGESRETLDRDGWESTVARCSLFSLLGRPETCRPSVKRTFIPGSQGISTGSFTGLYAETMFPRIGTCATRTDRFSL